MDSILCLLTSAIGPSNESFLSVVLSTLESLIFDNFYPFICIVYLVLLVHFNSVNVVPFSSSNLFRIIDLKSLVMGCLVASVN